jgi:predicted short-subunit dehydrogenase-like oxidoreductase (DUF2520 family)
MLRGMAKRPSVAIVGAGRLGSALAQQLSQAGYTIAEIVTRDAQESLKRARALGIKTARVSTFGDAVLDANLIWFCVPDGEIANVARALTRRVEWNGKCAFHSSGALAADELQALRRRGAVVASVHPFMTFVHGPRPSLRGVSFGLEGDTRALSLARKVVKDLGGAAFLIRKQDKTAYHAWGSFASPLLVALLTTAEEVAGAAGVSPQATRKRMMPILTQTLENYGKLGPAAAFSGPIIRGDVETVRRHLKALRKVPDARKVYLALAKAALEHLPAENKKKLRRVLK